MTEQKSTYHQSYHPSVTSHHASRTAEVDGGFILPHLKPNSHILDVGCGPGSISISFSKYVPQGSVTGVDFGDQVLEQAKALASKQEGTSNVHFEKGNVVEGLKYKDALFDVVFCNQVLTHIPDPVKAMQEMKRVCKPGGFVACREGDMPMRWYPYLEGLQLFNEYMYKTVFGPTDSKFPQNDPHAPEYRGGSLIHVWARKAGFDPAKIHKGIGHMQCTTEAERKKLAEAFIARIQHGGAGDKYKELGASDEQVQQIIDGFQAWADDVDGWFCLLQGEVICWV